MPRYFVYFLAAVCVIAQASRPVLAHHSFAAAFDAGRPVVIQGVLTEVRLANPHSWFFLDVKEADGTVTKWSFEGATPTSLLRSGVHARLVKAGDTVTIKGYHSRDASVNFAAARELVLADGRAFAIGPAVTPPPPPR